MASSSSNSASGATLQELKDAVCEAMDASGFMGDLKAKVRAEVMRTLQDDAMLAPEPSNENLFINELIREYLNYNGYAHTASVLIAESGQPERPALDRSLLAHDLKMHDQGSGAEKVPLLYSMVEKLKSVSGGVGPFGSAQESDFLAAEYASGLAANPADEEDSSPRVVVEDYAEDMPAGIAFTN